uniref:ATP synthase F0 subunit 6 n=1 Tax=Micrarionta opuntia TaxID=2914219 RepID=UPI001EF9FD76|nr:ATP synthase F0 subunit 6 [Micrarionta opuntia]UKG20829.1 ATP synthase F0 subunit 6 [Micrarionta opuntia]
MLTDLFSSLDGASTLLLWFLPLLVSCVLFATLVYPVVLLTYIKCIISSMWSTSQINRFSFLRNMLTAIFLFLLMNNLLGLTPYTYTLTSNLFTMNNLAMSFWLMLLLSGWFWSPSKSAAHLAPSGAPLGLLPFLIVIETISLLIRPLTLTVRLIANISAGHIVLGLLANTLTAYLHSVTVFLPLIMISIGYMLFEFFVSIIQAYIFTLLLSLYQTEHP